MEAGSRSLTEQERPNQGKLKTHWQVHQRDGYTKEGVTFPQA